MSNEYLVYAEDMKMIADAIRLKSGSSEQLLFPDGFVSNIQTIKAGGGMNFEIVNGTTQPENPVENTIWVNTTNAIIKTEINPQEPDNPIDGMLWLQSCQSGLVDLTMGSDDNVAVVYIQDSYIYTNGAWQTVESKVYQDGEWKTYVLRVYWYGDQNVDLTGGWVTTNNVGGTITYEDAKIKITAGGSESYSKNFSTKTNNPIDVTNYNTLKINKDWVVNNSGGADGVFGLFTNKTDTYKQAVASVNSKEAYIIDISGITGSYYIGFAGHTSAIETIRIEVAIKEVILSK